MDGLNTMTIQAKLLEHIFIFKKHSINAPPKVTVWLLSAVSFYLAQPPSVVSKCVLAGKQKASSECQAKCNTFFKKSLGDKNPRHLRGRLLIRETTASNCF